MHAAGNVVMWEFCWLLGLCSIFHQDSIVGVCSSPTSAFGQKFLQYVWSVVWMAGFQLHVSGVWSVLFVDEYDVNVLCAP